MKILMTESAYISIENIFDYLSMYSSKNAKNIVDKIYENIDYLERYPNIGRKVPEFLDSNLREIIYKDYRIIYKILQSEKAIQIIYIFNCKQDFHKFYKLHKKDFFDFNSN